MAEANTDQLRDELKQLRSDVQRITESLREVTAARGEETLEEMRERVRHARERASETEQAMEAKIAERPLSSVLTAFIGGLITGLFLNARR